MVQAISRAGWRARPPKQTTSMRAKDAKGLVLHHTVTQSGGDLAAVMRSMQNFHMDDKGWFDLAYNFCIGTDGTVFEARGWNARQGATSTPRWRRFGWDSQWANKRYYAVAFIGDFENRDDFTYEAKEAFKKLRRDLLRANSEATDIKIHKDFKLSSIRGNGDCPCEARTACPGQAVERCVQDLFADVDDVVDTPSETAASILRDWFRDWVRVKDVSSDPNVIRIARQNLRQGRRWKREVNIDDA